jgi:hypothetical protein
MQVRHGLSSLQYVPARDLLLQVRSIPSHCFLQKKKHFDLLKITLLAC